MSNSKSAGEDGRIEIARAYYNEGLSPGEWVARHAHQIGCWSLDNVKYSDEKLSKWVGEVDRLLCSCPEGLRSLREQYLRAEEIKEIENYKSKYWT